MGIAVHGDRVLVTWRHEVISGALFNGAIQSLDLSTGDRLTVSGGSVGTGPDLEQPLSISVTAGQIYVLERGDDWAGGPLVLGVAPSTGNRWIISNWTRGTGPSFDDPSSIARYGNTALVADYSLDAILGVDLTTGDRRIISDASRGSGPLFVLPTAIAVDGDWALVGDRGIGAVIAVDLRTGDRHLHSSGYARTGLAGNGPAFSWSNGISILGDVIYLTNRILDAVFALDLLTGERVILSK
jgi:hypothetical protein